MSEFEKFLTFIVGILATIAAIGGLSIVAGVVGAAINRFFGGE